jgi:hypothetical protein
METAAKISVVAVGDAGNVAFVPATARCALASTLPLGLPPLPGDAASIRCVCLLRMGALSLTRHLVWSCRDFVASAVLEEPSPDDESHDYVVAQQHPDYDAPDLLELFVHTVSRPSAAIVLARPDWRWGVNELAADSLSFVQVRW